jgi:DNA-binding transcriptional regulator GbsR (MarR family)
VHTDDYFCICSDDEFWKKFVTDMQKRFDTDVKDKCTSMVQMSVEWKDDTFEIHQRRQIEDIVEEFGEDTDMKKVDSPMEKSLNLPLLIPSCAIAPLLVPFCGSPDALVPTSCSQ